MKKWLFLLLLFPLTCVAQTYQYLGVEDGLSNRRVVLHSKRQCWIYVVPYARGNRPVQRQRV